MTALLPLLLAAWGGTAFAQDWPNNAQAECEALASEADVASATYNANGACGGDTTYYRDADGDGAVLATNNTRCCLTFSCSDSGDTAGAGCAPTAYVGWVRDDAAATDTDMNIEVDCDDTSCVEDPIAGTCATPACTVLPCAIDSDLDGTCNAVDRCTGDDATGDSDADGVCDSDDICTGFPNDDADGDGVCDTSDPCPSDNPDDSDGDGVCEGVDPCTGPDNVDADTDGVCDSLDICLGDDAFGDTDTDGVCEDTDPCDGFPNDDADVDGVCDTSDPCTGFPNDDADVDGVCDTSDPCTGFPNDDADTDGVCDTSDPCTGFPNTDTDTDGVCDSDDICTGDDATGDADTDGVCDDTDPCTGFPNDDLDSDGVCDSDDVCFGDDASGNSDGDDLCDDVDPCTGSDNVDTDSDGLCDASDPCTGPDNVDADTDGVCDSLDICTGDDATGDSDTDGICDGTDVCFGPDNVDADSDGVCDSLDDCLGDDASGDTDGDDVCDDIDPCSGFPNDDADTDGVCDTSDPCTGFPNDDADNDGVCDTSDVCDGDDATGDADTDGICDDVDVCFGPDNVDADSDGICDSVDLCEGDDATGDADGDGLCLDTETAQGLDDTDADVDDDGLSDSVEFLGLTPYDGGFVTTDPDDDDSDGDGIQDGTEVGLTAGITGTGPGFQADQDPASTTDPTDDDTDDDGLVDGNEDADADGARTGTETAAHLTDTDGDGLQDGTELGLTAAQGSDTAASFVPDADNATQTDPLDDDTDDDGLLDGTEDADGNGRHDVVDDETDPEAFDTDLDGLSDGLESGLSAPEGSDTDGLVFVADTDPLTTTFPYDADTDGDGLDDGTEDANGNGAWDGTIGGVGANCALLGETDPNEADTDGDGLTDFDELNTHLTCPLDADSDDDDLTDGDEIDVYNTDPNDDDTDGDGVNDGDEVAGGTDPSSDDPDEDGLKDGEELLLGTDPNDDDSDDDGLLDGGEQNVLFTDPLDPDSDGDGLLDGQELGLSAPVGDDTDMNVFVADADGGAQTTDPLDDDTDGDGLLDGDEDANLDGAFTSDESDPTDADTDDDGLTDDVEVVAGAVTCNDACTIEDCSIAAGCVIFDGTGDGICQDGGPGTAWTDQLGDGDLDSCTLGSDCTDCGDRFAGSQTDPANPDTDGDGIQDGTELGITTGHPTDTDPFVFVPDADPTTTTDPNDDDSDGDTVLDGDEDKNRDGAMDGDLPGLDDDETNPLNPDTDGDGDDDADAQEGIDADGDGRLDALDICIGTDRLDSEPVPWTVGDQDPDGDGFCNDEDPCNLVLDNDADGDNAFACDSDTDGPYDFGAFGGCATGIVTCTVNCGLIPCYGDCDDDDDTSRPGLPDACDAGDSLAQIDNDCDGSAFTQLRWVTNDPADATTIDATGVATYYPDADGDGFGASSAAGERLCPGEPNTSLVANDCDDTQASINEQATELCNGIDENCNFQIDEVDSLDPAISGCVTLFLDADDDGVGGTLESTCACATGEGANQTYTDALGQVFRRSSSDCDDLHAFIKPNECNDELDNDASGQADNNDPTCVPISARTLTPSAAAADLYNQVVLQGNLCKPAGTTTPTVTDTGDSGDTSDTGATPTPVDTGDTGTTACPEWPKLQPAIEGSECLDGIDNDGDGIENVDADDPDCAVVNLGTLESPIWAIPVIESPSPDTEYVTFELDVIDGHDNDCDGRVSVLELDCDDDGAFPLLPADLDDTMEDRRDGFVSAEELGLARCSGEARSLTCWDGELLTIECDEDGTGLWTTRYTVSDDGFGARFSGGFRNLTSTTDCDLQGDCDDMCSLRCAGQEETCDGVDNDCSGTVFLDVGLDGIPDSLDPSSPVTGTVVAAELDIDNDQNANCEGEFRTGVAQVQIATRDCNAYPEGFSTSDCDDLCYLASPTGEEACNGFLDVCDAPLSEREGTDADEDGVLSCGAYGDGSDFVEQVFVPVWFECDSQDRDGCIDIDPVDSIADLPPFVPLVPPRPRSEFCDTALRAYLDLLYARIESTRPEDVTSAQLVKDLCVGNTGGNCTIVKLTLDEAQDPVIIPDAAIAAIDMSPDCPEHPEETTLRTVWTADRIVDARLGTIAYECRRIYGMDCDAINDTVPALVTGAPPDIDDLLEDGVTWWVEVGRLAPDSAEGALMACWGDPTLSTSLALETGGDCNDASTDAHRDQPEGPADLVLAFEGVLGDCDRCTDAIDNNCDGLTDCEDPTCAPCFVGQGVGCSGGRDACVIPSEEGGCATSGRGGVLGVLLLPMALMRRRRRPLA